MEANSKKTFGIGQHFQARLVLSSIVEKNKRKKKRAPLKLVIYMCDICGYCYVARRRLEKHKIKHDKIFSFECYICEKKFKFERQLNWHYSVHDE